MKKLMVVAALALLAGVANASNYQWGLTTGKLDDTKVDAGTAYLCYYTGSTTGWGEALAALESYSADTITGTMGMQIVKLADKSDPSKATATQATFAYSSSKVNETSFISPASFADGTVAAGSFYYVVIDDGGKDIAYTTAANTYTINTGTGAANKKVLNSKFTYAHANGGSDTPEPTSGLLVILGVAGLALRRKQA